MDKSTFELILPRLPESVVKIAESGISSRSEVQRVAELGANAILVGETLVKSGNPIHTIKDLLNR
jgi:indole-3-glycerol phosphate synthase